MPNINDRPSAYIQDILEKDKVRRNAAEEARCKQLAAQRRSLGHQIREAARHLSVKGPVAYITSERAHQHAVRLEAIARAADNLYLHFEGMEPVSWLKPEIARQSILDMAQELGKIQDWLTNAMGRFQTEANEGLSGPGKEVLALRERAERSDHIRASLVVEAQRQDRRADKAEKTAAGWESAAQILFAENARLAQTLLQKLIPTQRPHDNAPSAEDALKAAILIEHNAVPDHGRYSGQHDCWEPHPDQPCACHDKPKVCRTCRTYTGDSVEWPCRTAEIALGD